MPLDGSHLICSKHLEEKVYCRVKKEWVCIKCELEDE